MRRHFADLFLPFFFSRLQIVLALTYFLELYSVVTFVTSHIFNSTAFTSVPSNFSSVAISFSLQIV